MRLKPPKTPPKTCRVSNLNWPNEDARTKCWAHASHKKCEADKFRRRGKIIIVDYFTSIRPLKNIYYCCHHWKMNQQLPLGERQEGKWSLQIPVNITFGPCFLLRNSKFNSLGLPFQSAAQLWPFSFIKYISNRWILILFQSSTIWEIKLPSRYATKKFPVRRF